MTDFDHQWKKVLAENSSLENFNQYKCNEEQVKKFLTLTGMKSIFKKTSFFKGKKCLDVGCGPGRWTCAMQRLGAKNVDSFDLSPEAIEICRKINSKAYVFNLMNLVPNLDYDFVLSWGVLHHTSDPRKAFAKVVSQVKKGGMLHVMLYDSKNDWFYDGFRGKDTESARRLWNSLSYDEKIKLCTEKSKEKGGNLHGWWDALNPEYNYSFSQDEVKQMFLDEGFTKIKTGDIKNNINMNGIKKF